jgi:ABC-type polysaccharide/polyol phosphate transport system ATPase subunit
LKQVFIDIFKGVESEIEISALKNIDFQLGHGEVLGVVGNNGAGKSTLLKIITGILPPSDGEVNVYGRIAPIIELGVGVSPDLTCIENIELIGVLLGYEKKVIRAGIHEITAWAGITEYKDLPVRTFSTGMLARLAFAIATFQSRELLIVDEVLAVGDRDFQSKSLKRIEDLMSDGEATILVSHDLSLIENKATKVLWLDQGRQMMFGDPREVLYEYQKS